VLTETEPGTRAEVSPDTQAVLLLCSELGASGEPRPLTADKYNRLAQWLAAKDLRPRDLLTNGALEDLPPDLPSPERLRALLGRGRLLGLSATKWLNFGIWALSRADESYPERLRKLKGFAPPLLFGAGPPAHLNDGGLAIVGSRDANEDAVEFTRLVAQRCAAQGIQVISGGARGVDREALTAALDSGGRAVAIPVESLLKVVADRTVRDAIREERLTVATPYDPEVGFTVGRAMGRNKVIYALADHAVVVQFTAGEGGTWAGAVERLDHNQKSLGSVPVFVRVTNDSDEGWLKLQNRGAHKFPMEDFRTGQILSVLAGCATGTKNPSPVDLASETPVSPPGNGEKADSCYDRCLPLLLDELRTEPSQKELRGIAKRLDLVPKQLNQWVSRAVSEGKLSKKKKGHKVVFVNAALAESQELFNNLELPHAGTDA